MGRDLSDAYLARQSFGVVLAGGRGERLRQLSMQGTKGRPPLWRQVPAHRLCPLEFLNSGIRRMAGLTQYNSHTLQQHLQRAWSSCAESSTKW